MPAACQWASDVPPSLDCSVGRSLINFDGDVHPAFLDVAEQFRRLFRRPGSGGGALAVFQDGVPVVDIWAGTKDLDGEQPWQRDTMALSFSTTKGVASTVIHRLVDRGLLDLEAPVTEYWPEFGANGKQHVTVTDLLTHRAGLHDVRHLVGGRADVLSHLVMEQLLAAAKPTIEPGTQSAYHGFTFGWLVSGLARAVTGQDMRDLFRTELAEPLGLDGLSLGVADGDEVTNARVAQLHDRGLSLASLLGSPMSNLPFVGRVAEALYVEGFDELLAEPERPAVHAQMPAANGVFTARSLARLYAVLAAGGSLDGVRLLDPASVERLATRHVRDRDAVLGIKMHWRLGYHAAFTTGRGSKTAFGHYGYGGSGAWCDPRSGLAVAFVTNRLGSGTTPIADSRLLRLNARITEAVDRIAA